MKCPRCRGKGVIRRTVALLDRAASTREIADCPTCEGEGNVRKGAVRYDRALRCWWNDDSHLTSEVTK